MSASWSSSLVVSFTFGYDTMISFTFLLKTSFPPSSSTSTPISEGSAIPDIVWKTRTRIESDDQNPFDWKDLTNKDLFAGKRVVLFSLPGAFTPTCSSTHLPGYEKAYEDILGMGVDEVYCLSVNDAFVMRQWGLHQGLEEDKTIGGLGFKKVN